MTRKKLFKVTFGHYNPETKFVRQTYCAFIVIALNAEEAIQKTKQKKEENLWFESVEYIAIIDIE